MSDATPSAAPAAPESTPVVDNDTSNPIETQENNETANEAATEATKADAVKSDAKQAKEPALGKKEVKAEAKKNIKKLKLKVDGKEIEEDFDIDNEEELIRNLQLSKVSQKRMAEHAQLKKEIDLFFDALQKNPEQVMREIGIDPEDFSVKTLQKKLEDQQKSPEQRELEKAQKELNDLREAQKRAESERKQHELTRLQAEHEQKIESDMITALEKHNLPNEPIVVKRMAEMMYVALENNIDLSAADIAPLVKKELENDMQQYIKAMPDEAIEQLLGKERLTGMRKKQVAAIKKSVDTANAIKPSGNENKSKEKIETKKISMSDLLGLRK